MKQNHKLILPLACAALLSACGEPQDKLEGERISIMSFEQTIAPDPRVQDDPVRVPPSFRNRAWSNAGGFASHAAYHLALAGVAPHFNVPFVSGNTGLRRIKSPPVVNDGKIFAMGSALDIVAADAETGERLWTQSLVPEGESADTGFGGGVASAGNRVFATTGFGEIVAMRADTGEVLWRVKNDVPFSNAPTVRDNRIYAVSRDSRLQVLSTADGSFVWEYSGIDENAGILSASSPAIAEQIAVVGFTSGEVVGLRTLNGTRAWEDALSSRSRQITPLSELNAIVGRPVIDRDRAFVVSHGGRMIALDIRSGTRIWTADIGSTETPWVMGEYILLLSLDGQIVCLSRANGRVRWVRHLAELSAAGGKAADFWLGPLLGGGRVLVASSAGQLLALSPQDGSLLETQEFGAEISVQPIIANGTLYTLTDSGRLIAHR